MLSSPVRLAGSFRHRNAPALGRAPVALLVALVAAAGLYCALSAGASGARPETGSGPVVDGGFDLATVEDLALFFAEESVRRLRVPLPVRLFMGGVSKKEEIEKIRRDPPKGSPKNKSSRLIAYVPTQSRPHHSPDRR